MKRYLLGLWVVIMLYVGLWLILSNHTKAAQGSDRIHRQEATAAYVREHHCERQSHIGTHETWNYSDAKPQPAVGNVEYKCENPTLWIIINDDEVQP